MKLRNIFILIISTIFSCHVFASLDLVINRFTITDQEKDKIELPKEFKEYRALLSLEKTDEDGKITRYLAKIDDDVNYAKTAFVGADYFYLGADSALPSSSAVVRVKLIRGSIQDSNSLSFIPLAASTAYLNGIKENDALVKKTNPVYDKRVDLLTLQSRNPVVTLQDSTIVDGTNFDAQKLVCLIDNIADGSSVKTNTDQINDAAGNSTAGVVGLAATSDKIVAAVKQNAANFGSGDGGFAVLIQKDSKLQPVNAQDGTDGNKAVQLKITADDLFAIEQAAGNTVSFGDMYFDSNLQRLFIGIVGATRENDALSGGDVSILVGRFDSNKLTIEPAVTLDKNLFNADLTNNIFGFYSSTVATAVHADTYKLKTMVTSTNKNYLIVNSSISSDVSQIKNKIYALPILGSKKSDGTAVDAQNIGKIADKNNKDLIVQNNAGMPLSSGADAVISTIGAGDLPIQTTDNVTDLFIVNDAVYVCVASDRSAVNHESGIFRSNPIFDLNGYIRAWTPWQRVMGNIDKVYGSGFDIMNANFWYLTQDGSGDKNTVKVTQWGKGSANSGLMGNGLVKLLNDEFLQTNAGVHQIFNFDENTKSIARTAAADKISFMAALGYKKVVLIKTGAATAGGAFTPTQDQFVKDTNVYVFEDTALNNLGPICCADVSRSQEDEKGWLFVGGFNGLAVLRNSDGSGWDGQVGSAAVDLATVASWDFKEIGNFSQVRKVVGDSNGTYFYVMTLDNIYRFVMDKEKFKDVANSSLDEKTLTPPPGYLLDMICFKREVNDTRLLVATTQGLFYSNAINDTDENKTPVWTKVSLNSGSLFSTPVSHLSFIDIQKGGYTTNGNLYALSADLSLNLATIYRFDVKDGVITAINENSGTDYFYSQGELRTNFITDGAMGFTTMPKHLGNTEYLKMIRMQANQRNVRAFEASINLNLESTSYNAGAMVLNTVSGAWIVPGDWGIRVNE